MAAKKNNGTVRTRRTERTDSACANAEAERTTAARAKFLEAYAEIGTVRGAVRASGIGRQTHYDWYEKDEEYRKAFEAAKDEVVERLEEQAIRRAHGFERKCQGRNGPYTVYEYSDRLMEFMLAALRPDKYGKSPQPDPPGKPTGPLTVIPDEDALRETSTAGDNAFN